ncbi:MAG: hypothetical protein PHR77_12950 [Kiritimatiellae bacterium]|nr:hypothetical protein [Kiritimatiellia bacterium]MDD5519425.1 hypothetical protein [Kiritimatiellia bacterium]
MNPVILSIFVFGMAVTILLPPLLIQNSSYKEKFTQMDGRTLIQTNMHAGLMKGTLRIIAYIIPLPVIILVRFLSKYETHNVIIGAAFIVVFTCLSIAQYFGVIDKLTTAEMENRKSSMGGGESS